MHLQNYHWLRWLLGVDFAAAPSDSTWQFVLRNSPTSWSVFVLLGVVVALASVVVFLYRREGGTCPHWAKLLLAGLRIGVILLLVGIYLDPALYLTQRRILTPSIVLLRDASQSMGLDEDRYLDDPSARIVAQATGRSVEAVRAQRPTRAALVNEVLERNGQHFLKSLASQGTLRVVDFAERPQQVSLETIDPQEKTKREGSKPASDSAAEEKGNSKTAAAFVLPPLVAAGPATDYVRAIREALSDRLVAAIVVFGDGQQTIQAAGQDELRRVAEEAGRRNVPLLLVGVGDPARPRNLSVTDIYADPHVWPQDPFEIKAMLRAQGISDEPVELSLIERHLRENGDPDGPEQTVAHRTVRIAQGTTQVQVAFKHTCTEPGRYSYTVRAKPLPNESNLQDNEPDHPVKVKVLSQQARVLLVSGEPTWEYLLLLRLLKQEKKSINLSTWLQTMDSDRDQEASSPESVIRHLPRTALELFQYDVVMLLDPNPNEFNEAWLRLLKEFVGNHAGGVLYMAGPKYSGQFLGEPKTRLMDDLIPVQLGDVARLEVERLLDSNTRQWKLAVTPANADHPIMRFYADTALSVARWQRLPGIYWSFPCEGTKPGAQSLIQRGESPSGQVRGGRPLLVTGTYGAGRIVYIGFNGTWRWRRTPNEAEFYKRFWIQTTRYLVKGRSVEGKRRGEIETDRTQYTIGQRIAVTARLMTSAYAPLELPRVMATLTSPGSKPEAFELRPVPKQPGTYDATLVAQHKGSFEVSLELPSEPSPASAPEPAAFSVALPSVELERPWLNKPMFVELAKASGGHYFELNELDSLAKFIPDRSQVVTAVGEQRLVRDSSRIPLLVVLVGLLCVEWGLRKRFKLV